MNLSESYPQLTWAFNSATIMHCPWEQELPLLEKFGWRAAEIWASKIQPRLDQGATTDQLKQELADAGIAPIGLCAGILTATTETAALQRETADLLRLLDLAQAMGAPALTVVIVGGASADIGADYDRLVERMQQLAEAGRARSVRINLEFLGGLPLNGTLGTGIELVNRVNHDHFGLLFDLCHYYTSASHLEELPLLGADKLFMVHVDDARPLPMELLRNEDRCFPGEGRINVAGLLNHLYNQANYRGYYTVELYDQQIWALDPQEVMERLAHSLTQLTAKLELT